MVTLLESILSHVRNTPDIRVAAIFGSQARRQRGGEHVADEWSDVDLQIVSTRAKHYKDFSWVRRVPNFPARVHVRRPVPGGVVKYTVLFDHGELDLVVVPYALLRLGRALFDLGLHRRMPALERGLANFTDVMRFGQVVVKGGAGWQRFYDRAVGELPRVGLDDLQVRQMADLAYVEAVWVLGRISRGELIAAQRMLHQTVVETNIQLLHEWRERRGLPAFHRARRAETVLPPEELCLIKVEPRLEAESLVQMTRSLIDGTRRLVEALVGQAPAWPPL
ncbi:MAG TPA: hypothetical protein VGD81_16865 [Opitutaceae bacterium]